MEPNTVIRLQSGGYWFISTQIILTTKKIVSRIFRSFCLFHLLSLSSFVPLITKISSYKKQTIIMIMYNLTSHVVAFLWEQRLSFHQSITQSIANTILRQMMNNDVILYNFTCILYILRLWITLQMLVNKRRLHIFVHVMISNMVFQICTFKI